MKEKGSFHKELYITYYLGENLVKSEIIYVCLENGNLDISHRYPE